MSVHRFVTALLLALVLLSIRPGAQDVSLVIVSPPDGSFASGPIPLRARIEPVTQQSQLSAVEFYADGKQVCRIERPPFECQWDAGARVSAHVIRAVGTLRDGRHLVHNVRTKDP